MESKKQKQTTTKDTKLTVIARRGREMGEMGEGAQKSPVIRKISPGDVMDSMVGVF